MKNSIILMAMVMLSSLIFAQEKGDRSAMAGKQSQKMKAELSLNDEQAAKIEEINKNFSSRHARLLADTAQTRANKALERKRLLEERNGQIKGVLTEEQFAQWMTIREKQMNGKRPSGKRVGSVKKEMEELKSELNLTDDQYKKMMVINARMAGRLKAMRSDSTITKENFRQEMKKLKEEKNQAMKTLLTEDQYTKFLAYENEKFPNRGKGGEIRNHEKHKKG